MHECHGVKSDIWFKKSVCELVIDRGKTRTNGAKKIEEI